MKSPYGLTTGDYAPSILFRSAAELQKPNTSVLLAQPGLPIITITYPLEPADPVSRRGRTWERLQRKNLLCVPERNIERRAKRKPKVPPNKREHRAERRADVRRRVAGNLVECERLALDEKREEAEISIMELQKALEHENRQTGFGCGRQRTIRRNAFGSW